MQSMVKGAFVLTVASFITKLLSAVYRVPFQNLVGDEGFYVYQQVYPIYGLAMTFSLSGLPQFISRYLIEQPTIKSKRQALHQLYPLVASLALLLWGATFFGGQLLAKLMGDEQLAPLIQVVSFTFLLIPGLAFYRGNFQSQLLMMPTAISQVVEQLVRVGVILAAAACFKAFSLSIYQTGTMAMAGALVGGMVTWWLLHHYERKINGDSLELQKVSLIHWPEKSIVRRFFVEGGLLSIYSSFLILFQLIDSFLITNALEWQGLQAQVARVSKGVYDRGQPLVQLGLVVALGLGTSFLPAMTNYLVKKQTKQFQQSAKMYLRLTTCFGAAASVGLALLMPFLNYTLFKDNAGSSTLMVFVFAVWLMATIQAYESIAQVQNYFRLPLRAAFLGLSVKIASTLLLTYYFGTIGASWGTLFGLAATLLCLKRKTTAKINDFWQENHFGLKLLLALLSMAVVLLAYHGMIYMCFGGLNHRSQTLLAALGGVAVGGTVFIQLLVWLKVFTLREWLLIPFGKKILQMNRKR